MKTIIGISLIVAVLVYFVISYVRGGGEKAGGRRGDLRRNGDMDRDDLNYNDLNHDTNHKFRGNRQRFYDGFAETVPASMVTMDILDPKTMRIKDTIEINDVDRKGVVIGRYPTCDVIMKERSVSRHHCVLKRENNAYYLEDTESTDGIYEGDDPSNRKKRIRLESDEIYYLSNIPVRFSFRTMSTGALHGKAAGAGREIGADGFLGLDDDPGVSEYENPIGETRTYPVSDTKKVFEIRRKTK